MSAPQMPCAMSGPTVNWTALSRLPLYRAQQQPPSRSELLIEGLSILAEMLLLNSKALTPGEFDEQAHRRFKHLEGRFFRLQAWVASGDGVKAYEGAPGGYAVTETTGVTRAPVLSGPSLCGNRADLRYGAIDLPRG